MNQRIFVFLVISSYLILFVYAHRKPNSFTDDHFTRGGSGSIPRFPIENFLRLGCANNMPMDRDTAKKSEDCLMQTIDEQLLTSLVLEAVSHQYDKLSMKVCDLWPSLRVCIGPVMDYLDMCNEKTFYAKTADAFLEFACSKSEDHALETTNLAAFFNTGGLNCIKFSTFQSCMKSSFHESLTFCEMLSSLRTCGQPAFVECVSERPWKILENMFDHLNVKMNCSTPVVDYLA